MMQAWHIWKKATHNVQKCHYAEMATDMDDVYPALCK
jgi:hypothetical protein